MEAGILIYNFLIAPFTLLSVPVRAFFKRGTTLSTTTYWASRLGIYAWIHTRKISEAKPPVIWIHAVSVGEAGVAELLVKEIKRSMPESYVILTVTTRHGLSVAHSRLSRLATIIPFPLDLPNVVSDAVNTLKPDIYISIETEIWPNLITLLHRKKVPILLLNGRISPKSFRGYKSTRWLWKPVLKKFSRLAMISEKNRERIVHLGAVPNRVSVAGNIKLARVTEEKDKTQPTRWKKILSISDKQQVVVFGSLREDENGWIPEIFADLKEKNPNLLGILAPRHLKRVPVLESHLTKYMISYQKLSRILELGEKRTASAILVDVIGELANIYSIASIAFCGGSLVPVGGHNILEPVTWGKKVFYGPYMSNFSDIKDAVEELGFGIQVSDKKDLAYKLEKFLKHTDTAQDKICLESRLSGFRRPLEEQVKLIVDELRKRKQSQGKLGI
ncbi:MAG TPA: hypothetical protein ENG51_16665 [Deltaproteobacteria bacterium]|nr:hypothetical protein [Deltaproteobacteria bacterium]